MNIWEALGLPSNHRPENKTVQLVKHYADVAEKVQWPAYGQIKKDGVYAAILLTPTVTGVFGRTGKKLTSLEHLTPEPSEKHGRVLVIAELCCDTCSLEELSGIVNPNRKKPLTEDQQGRIAGAYFAVHDMLYLSEFVEGVSVREYQLRYRDVRRYYETCAIPNGYAVPCVVLEDEEAALLFAYTCIEAGEEGMVGKSYSAGWLAGRKNEVAWKIVKGVDYDLEVLGVEEGKGKRTGMVANLMVGWRSYGDIKNPTYLLPCDLAGHKDDQRIEWFNDPSLIIGKIVHVHALCIGSKGALRLPKAKEVRIDKTEADL